jgi:outer membrane protein
MNLKLRFAIACLLTTGVTSLVPAAHGADLLEVYERALQSDPQIREADATRLASREAKPQALAALLPDVSGSASASRTESGGDAGIDLIPVANTNTTTTTNTTSLGATLSQPIFHWDSWVALKRADAQVAQAEITYKAAEQDLIVRVAQRYFGVLGAQDTLDASNAAAESATQLLEQAQKRFEVGLIAVTDVQEQRAERDRTAADVISAKRALASAQEQLRAMIGESFDKLAPVSDQMPLKAPEPADVERWTSAAAEQNLNLISARLNSDIASDNVGIQRAGHLPSLDLAASYRKTNSDISSVPYDTTQDTKQVGITLNVPIFSGGATQSRVRQAVYTHRAARERVERVSRETESSARDNYLGVISNMSQVTALRQAYESQKVALQATEAGYEVGTRTSVDVLATRRALFSAQTAYLKSRYDYIASVLALELAAGTLGKEDVVEINKWLQENP